MALPSTPVRVRWKELHSPALYEDMVATLLSILHPTSVRTDGSGGDGGRDVHFAVPGGDRLFQLKYHPERLGKSQRAQIKGSFDTAMKADPKPAAWTLVLPIDLSPGEQLWFKTLTSSTSVPCLWKGKTWLDGKMALYPCVPRYFLNDANDEVIELIKLLNAEQAVLAGGIPDALERLGALKARCDEINPYYYVDLATDTATNSVQATVRPRFPNAARDCPIGITAHMVFPDEAAAEATKRSLQATYDFGTETKIPSQFMEQLVVDAPAGLGGEFGPGTLVIAQKLQNVPNVKLRMRVKDPKGKHLAELELSGKADSLGAKGALATLLDGSGVLRVKLRFDFIESSVNVDFEVEPAPCKPAALLPALHLLEALITPNEVEMFMPDGEPIGPPAIAHNAEPLVEAFFGEVVRKLSRVQDRTHNWFDMPEVLSHEELDDLWVADALLSGQSVKGKWEELTPMERAGSAQHTLDTFAAVAGGLDQAGVLGYFEDVTVNIAGHKLDIGPATTVLHRARLVDPWGTLAAVKALQPDERVKLTFVPDGGIDTFEQRPGGPDDYATLPPTTEEDGAPPL